MAVAALPTRKADHVALTAGQPEMMQTALVSERGPLIARCPTGDVAVWSRDAQAGPASRFVRGGTPDEAGALMPDGGEGPPSAW